MSTVIYYNQEERHSLPSLSSIMNTSQASNVNVPVGAQSVNGSISGADSSDIFSNHGGSQPSSTNTTPASSFSGSSTGYFHEGKCTCKSNANRIPRPRNAFILFRQKYHQSVLDEGSVIRTNPEVSRELGRRWRALSNEERDHWNKLAEEEKTNHAKKYPGYRYTPRRNGKGKFCDFCKQKSLRQQQIQLHNHQLIQMQQDQYYLFQQLQLPMQQGQPQQVGQMNNQYGQYGQTTPQATTVGLQQPYNNMVYMAPNPIQTNFQFQYNNDFAPNQEKLSPLSQVPLPYDHHYHHQQPQPQPQAQSQVQPQAQPQLPAQASLVQAPQQTQQNPQFAIGFEQPRFNSLPTPVSTNLTGNYGFEYQG